MVDLVLFAFGVALVALAVVGRPRPVTDLRIEDLVQRDLMHACMEQQDQAFLALVRRAVGER